MGVFLRLPARLVAVALLLFTLLLVAGLQLLSLLILPFSEQMCRKLNSKWAGVWWSFLALCLEKAFQVKLTLEGQISESPVSSVFLIANHQSFLDPLLILMFSKKQNTLSHLRWFVKASLRYVPFLGWGLWLLDCVFLKRNWNQDQSSVQAHFKKILQLKDPIWLILFPEGTRKTEEKLEQSKKGFQNVLHPRPKGFIATMQALSRRIDFVYDLTLLYSEERPQLSKMLLGQLGPVRLIVQKYPVADLPSDEVGLRDWLMARFQEKDAIFLREKRVPSQ